MTDDHATLDKTQQNIFEETKDQNGVDEGSVDIANDEANMSIEREVPPSAAVPSRQRFNFQDTIVETFDDFDFPQIQEERPPIQ